MMGSLLPDPKGTIMTQQYYLLAALALGLILALMIWSAAVKKRKLKQRDFDRKLETVLKSDEEVTVIHNDRSGRWILTSHRLLLDTKEGFTALAFSKIKSISGLTAEGKKTVAPAKMVSVTIKADKEIVLRNTGETFVELVKQLKKKTAKPRKK